MLDVMFLSQPRKGFLRRLPWSRVRCEALRHPQPCSWADWHLQHLFLDRHSDTGSLRGRIAPKALPTALVAAVVLRLLFGLAFISF